jgi:hypothetical protein
MSVNKIYYVWLRLPVQAFDYRFVTFLRPKKVTKKGTAYAKSSNFAFGFRRHQKNSPTSLTSRSFGISSAVAQTVFGHASLQPSKIGISLRP